MPSPSPIFERTEAAPEAIRSEIAALVPRWLCDAAYGGAASLGASADARRWLFSSTSCVFEGSIWLSDGVALRRIPLADSSVRASSHHCSPLASVTALLADAGLGVAEDPEASAHANGLPALQPAFGLEGGRMLWLALRVGRGAPPAAAVVLLDATTGLWRALRPAPDTEPIDPRAITGLAPGERPGLHLALTEPGALGVRRVVRELDLERGTIAAPQDVARKEAIAVASSTPRLLRAFARYGERRVRFVVERDRVRIGLDDGSPTGSEHLSISPALRDLAIPLGKVHARPRFGLAAEAVTGDLDEAHVIVCELLRTPGTRRIAVWARG